MSILKIWNVRFLIFFNIKGLRFLVQICQDLGLPYENYNAEFMKLKRKQEAEEAKFSDFQNMGDDYLNQDQYAGGGGGGGGMPMQQQAQRFEPPPMESGVNFNSQPTRYDFFWLKKQRG